MTAPKILRQLADPDSPAHILSYAAITGALTLLAPWRRKPGASLAIHSAETVVSATTSAMMLRKMPALRDTAGYVVGVFGLVIGLGPVGDAMNRRIDDALTRRGVRNVPAWMALGAAAVTALSLFTPKDRADAESTDEELSGERVEPLDDNLRAIVSGIIDAVDVLDVSALRGQLTTARQSTWDEPGEPTTVLQIVVDDSSARFTPYCCVLPVQARFDVDGTAIAASLFVEDGLLQSVTLDFVTEPEEFTPFEGVTTWPHLADVSFVDEVRGTVSAPRP